jgi:hypothetical protein
VNRIITFNGGNFWHPNAKASVEAAAKRWGVELVEIKNRLYARDWFAAKFRIGPYVDDRALFLDADVVIRSDCPSPFDVVPESDFGAVANFQDGMIDHEKYQRPSWELACRMLGMAKPYDVGQYINAGLILFSKRHLPTLDYLDRRCTNTDGVNEQAAWSVMLADENTTYLPKEWNRVGPAVWKSGPDMKALVYHFASYLQWRPEHKAAKIAETRWQL